MINTSSLSFCHVQCVQALSTVNIASDSDFSEPGSSDEDSDSIHSSDEDSEAKDEDERNELKKEVVELKEDAKVPS